MYRNIKECKNTGKIYLETWEALAQCPIGGQGTCFDNLIRCLRSVTCSFESFLLPEKTEEKFETFAVIAGSVFIAHALNSAPVPPSPGFSRPVRAHSPPYGATHVGDKHISGTHASLVGSSLTTVGRYASYSTACSKTFWSLLSLLAIYEHIYSPGARFSKNLRKNPKFCLSFS